IAHAKPASDFLDIDGLAFEREARISSDYEQPLEARERGDDFFYHAVREVFLFGVAAHVLERQHGDGRLVGQRRRALGLSNARRRSITRFTPRTDLIGHDWLLNVSSPCEHQGPRRSSAGPCVPDRTWPPRYTRSRGSLMSVAARQCSRPLRRGPQRVSLR